MLGDETRRDAIDEPAEPAQVIAVELVEPPWVAGARTARFLTARRPVGSNSGPFSDPAVLSWMPGRPHGQVAQLVEQRTENPRVGGSIPPLATTPNFLKRKGFPASPADYRGARAEID